MYAKTALIALAATTVAAEQYYGLLHPGALMAKRDILARQSSAGGDDTPTSTCISALLSVASSIPTPPPEIASYESANPITDACSFSVPNSLSSAFSAYESSISSWASGHSSAILSILSQCPQYSSLATGGQAPPVCTSGSSGGSGGSGTTTAATTAASTTGSGSGSSSSSAGAAGGSSSSKAAAPRETGFVGAAIAAAGLLAVAL